MKITIKGNPVTKKNSSRIIKVGNYSKIIPSKAYVQYEREFIEQCKALRVSELKLNGRYNVGCCYYMQTKRKVDLTNLLSATMDCLISAGVLEDDNSNIVTAHDGCYVAYDKDNPRTEITIEKRG